LRRSGFFGIAVAEHPSRKLAAILAADIAGYSTLMGLDEARTVRDLKGHQAVVLPMIGEFGGRIIDTAGDGILAEFASVVHAVECAVAIQKEMAQRNTSVEQSRRMQFRIGINIGDVIFDGVRIYGDGINVAARLEAIAEPGGISLSRQAYDQVEGKLAFRFRKLGPHKLKNISKPLEVLAIDIADATSSHSEPANAAILKQDFNDRAADDAGLRPGKNEKRAATKEARFSERQRVERRLTAILVGDVAGYSRLIGADDEGTLARLNAHHDELIAPRIKQLRGRIVRTTGDGLLVLFGSVVDALRCAIDIQRGMTERNAQFVPEQRIEFRMGIDVGDIIIDGRSIHGEGINVAARLEGLAYPGGICISSRAREDVRDKFDIAFEDAGEQQLKNISRPVRVYRVEVGAATRPTNGRSSKSAVSPIRQSGESSANYADRDAARLTVRQLLPLRLLATHVFILVILLLLAHYLIIMKLDLDPLVMRSFSLLLPALSGIVISRQTRCGLGVPFLLGGSAGILSVFGMLIIVGLFDATATFPTSRFEWQEAMEYAVGIALSTVLGSVLVRIGNSALRTIRRG
jgi:class 3 adenylate cyclase